MNGFRLLIFGVSSFAASTVFAQAPTAALAGRFHFLESRQTYYRVESDLIPAPARRRGTVSTRDALAQYVDHVMSFIDPSIVRPFNVVLDAGSGMGGLVAPKLFDRLPCRTTQIGRAHV